MTAARSAAVAVCLSLAVVACRCGPAATRYLVEVPAPDAAPVPPELVVERLPDLVIDADGALLDFEPLAAGGGIVAVGRGDELRIVHVDDDGRVVRELLEIETHSSRLDLAVAGQSVWVGIAFGYEVGGSPYDSIRYRGRERRAVGSRPDAVNGDLLVMRIRIADGAIEVERQLGDHAAVSSVRVVARSNGVDIAAGYGALRAPTGTMWGQPASAIQPDGRFVARLDEHAQIVWFAVFPGVYDPSIASDEDWLVVAATTRHAFEVQGARFTPRHRNRDEPYVAIFNGDGRLTALHEAPWQYPHARGYLRVQSGAISFAQDGRSPSLWERSSLVAPFQRVELPCRLLQCVAESVVILKVGTLITLRSFDIDDAAKLELVIVPKDTGAPIALEAIDVPSSLSWFATANVVAGEDEVVVFHAAETEKAPLVIQRVRVTLRPTHSDG